MKKRVITNSSLLFASISATIGSGWLFTAYYTSMFAGPASLISWVLGGFLVIVVAFTFAELSAFLPVTGATIRVPRYTHGVLVGFMFSWILWLSYVSLAAVEVQAMIQYASFFFPGVVKLSGGLTGEGYIWATVLMLVVVTINLYSLRWLIRCNNAFTILKLTIPVFIAVAVIVSQVSHHTATSFHHHPTFMPYGVKGIFMAITSGGIVFAFNGFKQASEMSGEAENPQKALPFAIIGSVLICLIIFLCLQTAFLSTVHDDLGLAVWQTAKLSGINSPFAMILTAQKLNHLLPILYVGAVVGPFAASLMYCGSAARALYAMSKSDCVSPVFSYVTKSGIPIRAIMINFLLGMCLFAPFPGWSNMASFLTSLMALSYVIAPIGLMVLRKHCSDHERFFKLPFANVWCWVAFCICSLFFYWSGWNIVSKLYPALILGLVVLFCYRKFNKTVEHPELDWRMSVWIWPYFIGMSILSYYGSFNGKGVIPFGWDFIPVILLATVCLWLAMNFSFDRATIRANVDKLKRQSAGY